MNRLQRYYYLGQAIGWDNIPRRLWQIAKNRLGISRRKLPGGELSADAMPANFIPGYEAAQATDRWQARSLRFFFAAGGSAATRAAVSESVDDAIWDEKVSAKCDELRAGRMQFFASDRFVDTGWPPVFNHDPVHGVTWPTPRHWSSYVQFDPSLKDIKCIWEASRFSWAFLLARQHVRKPTSGAAELFWAAFDAWDEQNPYGLTPQWACGQESTFRLFAWLFAAIATLGHPSATNARLARLTERVWYTGRHIEGNINYARGQKNNHAISEAVGLWTIGLLFPELRRAAHWRRAGREVLTVELMRQIYPDGSYVQHSVNYHRVMLDDVLWGARLGELQDELLPVDVLERLRAAARWMIEMIEPTSGGVPNLGANDGALVLPLSTCDYTDYRPTAQAAHQYLFERRLYGAGPWDETCAWLYGEMPLARTYDTDPTPRGGEVSFDDGGYYTFKGSSTWGLTRCHTYRDRPGQADMLHFDLWLGAVNLLRDGGTYHYYCEPPWQAYFKSTRAHNTVEVDGQDQMIPGPRFTWLRWTRSRLHACNRSVDHRIAFFEGEHDGYGRLPGRVIHRRSICRVGDNYVVVDDLLGGGEHTVTVRWRLYDIDWRLDEAACVGDIDGRRVSIGLTLPNDARLELARGHEPPHPEGWESRYYSIKSPTPTLAAGGRLRLPARFVTLIQTDQPALLRVADAGEAEGPVRLAGCARDVDSQLLEATAGRIVGVGHAQV